ncbi:MAG TPA: hypothetical protein VJZ04_09215 [Lachnospiraceae bacterium]|nr:hypothetical protein [Lachnospiraceae bacterium]
MAFNTVALNTVYNHYLTSYAPKGTSQFDAHKKSELRSIYNSIVTLNKESPLCIMDTSKASQEFAVGIKENARELRNTIASLGGLNEDEILNKKVASSSNESIASAKFVGNYSESDEVPSFEIEVNQLASKQVNTGYYLPSNERTLKTDSYSFDIGVNDLNYEFQFTIHEGDTNLDIQKRLAALVSNAGIGIDADVLEDGEGNSSLALTSKAVGLPQNKTSLFDITDDNTSRKSGTIEYLGINDITRPACNSKFKINGSDRTALSNNFSVEKMYEINLNGLSSMDGETASIGLKADMESLTENVSHLINGYNSFIKAASSYRESQPKSNGLLSEIGKISSLYNKDLTQLGMNIRNDGSISMDKNQLAFAVSGSNGKELLSPIKDFTNSLLRKTNQVTLNPMKYVDKTIVAYKNPGRNFASPYVTSSYSGMMFNSFC